MDDNKKSLFDKIANSKATAKNVNYLSGKELRKISKENRRITDELEKIRNRNDVSESEYSTVLKNSDNILEIDNLHT